MSESAEIVFILNKTTIHDFLLFRNNIDIVILQTRSMSGGNPILTEYETYQKEMQMEKRENSV